MKRLITILFVVFCLLSRVCKAGHESYTGTSGPKLTASDTFSVTDPKYFSTMCPGCGSPGAWGFTNHRVIDRVSLNLNYLSTAYSSSAFTVTTHLKILYDIAGTYPSSCSRSNPTQTRYVTLKISYNPKTGHRDLDDNSYVFKNAYHMIVQIDTITSSLDTALLHSMVRIDGYIDIDRYYKLDTTSLPSLVHYSGASTANEQVVQWKPVVGAENYQLEWRWLDSNKNHLLNSPIWFQDSSTRVTISAQPGQALPTGYTIPMMYENGYVVCRVRAVGRTGKSFNVWEYGPWTLPDNDSTLSQFLSLGSVAHSHTGYVFYTSGFENTLNWQYTGTYAEDGKKKTLISFFDGSLRERQTLTKNYSVNRVIVAEDFYDHVGRKAVSALPVPLNDSILKYHTNLNLDHYDSLYSWKDFELDSSGDSCDLARADSMVSSSGSSKYYSSRNGLTDFHKYLPNANSYPFAQTEFTPDNTNRIRRQGGVGSTYQLNSGHETKYYYGVPVQQELDGLFGNDVGYASRYKKNMVIDANGQISVSYLDAHGRVIATGLAGNKPTALWPISSNTGPVSDTTVNILDSVPGLQGNTGASILNYPLMVSSSGAFKFTYQFTPEKFTNDGCIFPDNSCYDGVYDLNIFITNECNQVIAQTSRYVGHWPADTICGNNLDSANVVWTVSLNIGNYTIHKSLTIDDSALNYYTTKYIQHNSCLKTYDEFYSQALDAIDFSGCNSAACTTCQQYNTCQAAYNMMLGDVSPGGQYAQFYVNTINGTEVVDTLPLSVLNAHTSSHPNKLPRDSANWKHPHTPYLDENGARDTVTVNGIKYTPDSLPDMFTFVQNWKPSWAASLVYYHPEYPYYQWCVNNRATGSDAFDSTLMAINTYYDAKRLHYLDPLGMPSSRVVPSVYGLDTFVQDPFFNHVPTIYKKFMKNRMQKYFTSKTNTNYSLWQAAIAAGTCPGVSLEKPVTGVSEPSLQSCLSSFDTAATGCINDSMWQKFKLIYLAEKNKIKNIVLNQYAIANKGFNGCIGSGGSSFQFTLLDTNYNEQDITCYSLSSQPTCTGNLYSAEGDNRQPCSSGTRALYATKQPRFQNMAVVFNTSLSNTNSNAITSLQTNDSDSTSSVCLSQCQSYVPVWRQELAGCGMDSATQAKLLDTLVNICAHGCDVNNPIGASSVQHGVKGGYQNFDQAIRGMSGHANDTSCSALLISSPLAYLHNYNFHQDTTGFTSCSGTAPPQPTCISCAMLRNAINSFNSEYPAAGSASNFHQLLDGYLNAHLNTNFMISDFDSLKEVCDSLEPIPLDCSSFGFGTIYPMDSDTAADIRVLLNKLFADTPYIFTKLPYKLDSNGSTMGIDTMPVAVRNLFPYYLSVCQPALYMHKQQFGAPYFQMDILSSCGRNYNIQFRFPGQGYDAKNLQNNFRNIRMYNTVQGANYSFLIDDTYKQYSGFKDSAGNPIYDTSTVTLTVTTSWEVSYCSGASAPSAFPKMCASNSSDPNSNSAVPPVKLSGEGLHQYWCNPMPVNICGCDKIFQEMKDYNSGHPGGETFQDFFMSQYGGLSGCAPTPNISNLFHNCLNVEGFGSGPADSTNFVNDSTPSPATGDIDNPNWANSQAQTKLRNLQAEYPTIQMPSGMDCHPSGDPSAVHCISCFDINNQISNALLALRTDSTHGDHTDSQSVSDPYGKVSSIVSSEFGKNITVLPRDTTGCPACAGGWYTCENVTVQAQYLDSLLSELAKTHNLVGATPLDTYRYFTNYLKPVDSFTCSGYNYSASTSGDTLFATITGTCTNSFSCTIKLVTTGVAFSPLDSFGNIRINKGADGTTYSFLIDGYTGSAPSTFSGTSCYPIAQCCGFTSMCPKIKPRVVTLDTSQCRASLNLIAEGNARDAYNHYIDSIKANFQQRYTAKCMATHEKFFMNFSDYRYHFTLYYYDQAGNLVKTVPPKGVSQLTASQCKTADYRRIHNGTRLVPTHTLLTKYKYNSLNEQVWTQSPNADSSQSWYDNLGRVAVSQSGRQRPLNLYSYTVYDKLGRITEVGETHTATAMVDSVGLKASLLTSWLSGGTHDQITKTYYDSVVKTYISAKFGTSGQQFLRGRVSTIAFYNYATDTSWAHATHYSYDPHGNVSTLIQDFPELAMFNGNSRFKRIDYQYDLISQNVNEVTYQAGQIDQWHHRYEYDLDNRLVNVYTSVDSVLWDIDAQYTYYRHGPLARINLGRLNVQGIDYTYTLQGWIKGVNSDYLSNKYDPGQDGYTGNWGLHHWVARDAVGFSLGYFNGDYTAVNATNTFSTINYSGGSQSGLTDTAYRQDLYNGNIAHMITAIGQLMSTGQPLETDYRYDQLNRLRKAFYFNNMDTSTHVWGTANNGTNTYGQAFTYDEDGNLLTHVKNGDTSGGSHSMMDELSYNYNSGNDQLNYVTNSHSTDSRYPNQLINQSSNNYRYDGSGELMHDASEQIDTIKWSPYGKVLYVRRTSGSAMPGISFAYGADGQRVEKIVKPDGKARDWKYYWYVRDAQGNIMAVYKRQVNTSATDTTHLKDSLTLVAEDMYGSSRLGEERRDTMLIKLDYNGSISNTTTMPSITTLHSTTTTTFDTVYFTRTTGIKRYELSNHLGNVLATISDRHIRVQSTVHSDSTAYFKADVITATDYYAFGEAMPGRGFRDSVCHKVAVLADTTYPTVYDTVMTINTLLTGQTITMNDGRHGHNYTLSSYNPSYTSFQNYMNEVVANHITGYTFAQVMSTNQLSVTINKASAGLSCGDTVTFHVGSTTDTIRISCPPIITYDTTYKNLFDTTMAITSLTGQSITMDIDGTPTILSSFNPSYSTYQGYVNDVVAASGSGVTFTQVGSTDQVGVDINLASSGLTCGDSVTFYTHHGTYPVSIGCTPIITYDTTYPTDYTASFNVGTLNPGESITLSILGGPSYTLSNWNPIYTFQDYINDIVANGNGIPGFNFTQVGLSTTVNLDINQAAAGLSCGAQVQLNLMGAGGLQTVNINCPPTITPDTSYATDYDTTITVGTLTGQEITQNDPVHGTHILSYYHPGYGVLHYVSDVTGSSITGYTFTASGTTVTAQVNKTTAGLSCGNLVTYTVGTTHTYSHINCTPIITPDTTYPTTYHKDITISTLTGQEITRNNGSSTVVLTYYKPANTTPQDYINDVVAASGGGYIFTQTATYTVQAEVNRTTAGVSCGGLITYAVAGTNTYSHLVCPPTYVYDTVTVCDDAALYPFAFNGKLKTNEFAEMDGDDYDYGLRMYDPRLGRFLSIDPMARKFPWWTPYQFAGNMPIRAKDLDGAEPEVDGYNNAKGVGVTKSDENGDLWTWATGGDGSSQWVEGDFGFHENDLTENQSPLQSLGDVSTVAKPASTQPLSSGTSNGPNKMITAEEANEDYGFPPYKPGTPVSQGQGPVDDPEDPIVRFSNGSTSNPIGRWGARYSDVKGMTPEEIQNALHLKSLPTQMGKVNMFRYLTRIGTANAPNMPDNEGLTQYEIMDNQQPIPSDYGPTIQLQNNVKIEDIINLPENVGLILPSTKPGIKVPEGQNPLKTTNDEMEDELFEDLLE